MSWGHAVFSIVTGDTMSWGHAVVSIITGDTMSWGHAVFSMVTGHHVMGTCHLLHSHRTPQDTMSWGQTTNPSTGGSMYE
jgi:hypothetical protein